MISYMFCTTKLRFLSNRIDPFLLTRYLLSLVPSVRLRWEFISLSFIPSSTNQVHVCHDKTSCLLINFMFRDLDHLIFQVFGNLPCIVSKEEWMNVLNLAQFLWEVAYDIELSLLLFSKISLVW